MLPPAPHRPPHRPRWPRLLLALVAILGTLSLLAPAPAGAATLTVTNGNDSGSGSLRDTLVAAAPGDTVVFASGVMTVSLTSGQLTLTKNVTIQGDGTGGVTIQRSNAVDTPNFRIFFVSNSVTATLSGLTISNGVPADYPSSGGGIYNDQGTLTLTNCIVSSNRVVGEGGGIFNDRGTLTLTNTTFSDNEAGPNGGGLYTFGSLVTVTGSTFSGNAALDGGGFRNATGTLLVTDTTVSGNRAGDVGGGISVSNTSIATISNSIISGNSAQRLGGGLLNLGTLTLTNSTISGNSSDWIGGGLYNANATVTLTNSTVTGNIATYVGGGVMADGNPAAPAAITLRGSIIAGNTSPSSADCDTNSAIDAPITTTGYNVVGDGTGCPSGGTGDLAYSGALSALFDPTLADNGGPTRTHALVANSVALDRLPAAQCTVATDQRGPGFPRPQPSGGACDSGAYEATSFTLTTGIAGTGSGTLSPAGGDYPAGTILSLSATPTGGSTLTGWTVDGNPAGNTNPLTVTMSANRSVVATFAAAPSPSPSPSVLLTVVLNGTGAVARNQPGTGSGPFGYAHGTVVTLTPQPGTGQTFTGWVVDGASAGWASPLTITMNVAHTAQATFAATKTFTADLPASHPNATAITELATRGNILGYSASAYGPADGVQRAQMAALIARATPTGPGTPTNGTLTPPACTVAGSWDCEDWGNGFTDQGGIDAKLWRDAGTLQHYGVAFGYTAQDCAAQGRIFPCYGPTDPVSYAQTIAFITRAMIAKGYWVAQPNASLPYAGVPGVLATEVRTFHLYTGGVPAPPADWNGAASRGWFAQALWAALNAYWGADGPLPDGRNAGGFVP